ncbi:glutamate receptor ionotropic, kainate 5 [Fukomys damarensis]|uniref:glutamate receptor ionotropic, kainate 5 n=1 Tax=Fukomys damarensis TaxID=885580 RepID=UPI00054023C8|nr:glutamate receptor ionotropic, kainate 5 [Fukomys damarensis]
MDRGKLTIFGWFDSSFDFFFCSLLSPPLSSSTCPSSGLLGSHRFGLVGGHCRRRGRGPCELPSPPAPATPSPRAGASPGCRLSFLGPRGSPALRPTRIRGEWGPRQVRPHEEGRKMPAELLLLLIVAFASPSCQVLSSLRMAAILDDQTVCGRGERLALALAREQINGIIEVPAKARVEVDIFELQRDSQYETTDTMCQILPKGVVSVLGPSSSPASASTVSHICGEKEIPHIKVGPEETPRLQYLRFASVSLYPSNEDVSLAVSRILKSFNYPSASLICAKAECLLRLEELVRGFLISKETLSVRMLDDSRDPTPLLKEIRDDKVSTIIIDANASISHLVLRKASELGMTSAFYKYILTTMDFPILHLDGIVEDSSNILGFSMFNTSHPFYPEFVRSLNMSWRENCEASTYPGPALSAALMFDAVHVVVSAVRELNRSQEIGVKPLACTSANIWPHGTSLMNYLRMVEYDGLTGRVEFNSKGQRTNYTLRILEKSRQGHREIGVWYSNRTLAMNATTLDINLSQTLANKTLVVTTILENPYVMRRPNFQALSGNERFEGFCVDMLRELAELLRFRYRLRLVEDGLYGAPEPNGSWTGMVGELINRKADLAVAAFTITAEREKVIDFSKPFMTLGISILYRVHMGRKPGYFSFLDPFSPAVWLFMLLAYLAVSCVLFLAARLSPYEWYNPHPCLRARPHILENQYTLGNSLWFPVGGFMQQGSEIMPRALSTRCVSGVWWAFTLIIISSYTANLAAFLTVQRMEVPVESADDLADQTNIEYGTIHAGSTMTFFQNSRYQTYQRMWNYMQSKQPSVFVKSTEEGIARVLNSRYAFLLESTMNEYHRRLNCNLTQIGGLLDTKGYGIGMPLGSPFRDEITLAILQLQENNRLEILKRKWWEGGRCPKEEDHRAKGLGMENIGGIFVVLICGLIIAVFVAVMEFIWSTRRSAESEETSPDSVNSVRDHMRHTETTEAEGWNSEAVHHDCQVCMSPEPEVCHLSSIPDIAHRCLMCAWCYVSRTELLPTHKRHQPSICSGCSTWSEPLLLPLSHPLGKSYWFHLSRKPGRRRTSARLTLVQPPAHPHGPL